MKMNKIHRRHMGNKRAEILPLAGTTTTAHTTSTAGTSNNGYGGPPLVNAGSTTTSAAAAVVTTTTSTTAASSSSTASAVSLTSATSVPTTPPAAATTPLVTVSPPAQVTRTTSIHVTYSSTSHSASPTTTSDDSSGMGLGSIAGIAVAAIIGIGVVSAFVIWLIRRRNKNRDIDEEPFNRNSFLRNSTAIPDDDDAPLPSRVRPAPGGGPAMSERSPTPLYGQQNNQFVSTGPEFGYATQPSYGAVPGGMYSPNPFGPGGAPATPLPHSPGFNNYDQGYGNGGYAELTRGSGMHDYPPSPASRGFAGEHYDNPHSPSYVGHDAFPMPPPAAAAAGAGGQEGVTNRAMTPAQQGHVVVGNSEHDGRETPVQLGFAPAPHGQPMPHGQQQQQGQQQGQMMIGGRPGQHGQRPETVYDPEDAYGGI